jgi:hypothetical protein
MLQGTRAKRRGLVGLLALMLLLAGAGGEEWQDLHRDADLVVEARRADEGRLTVRGRGDLPHPFPAVRAVLLDLEAFPRWGRNLRFWKVLARSGQEAIVYGRHDLPRPLADRDYVVRYTWRTEADRFLLEAGSTCDNRAPPVGGVERLTLVHSVWEVRPAGPGQALVSYLYDGDLGGAVPPFLQRWTAVSELRELFSRLAGEVERRARGPASFRDQS